jgi:hypothetical protein
MATDEPESVDHPAVDRLLSVQRRLAAGSGVHKPPACESANNLSLLTAAKLLTDAAV